MRVVEPVSVVWQQGPAYGCAKRASTNLWPSPYVRPSLSLPLPLSCVSLFPCAWLSLSFSTAAGYVCVPLEDGFLLNIHLTPHTRPHLPAAYGVSLNANQFLWNSIGLLLASEPLFLFSQVVKVHLSSLPFSIPASQFFLLIWTFCSLSLQLPINFSHHPLFICFVYPCSDASSCVFWSPPCLPSVSSPTHALVNWCEPACTHRWRKT